jgi:hypothetical protein
MTINPIKNPAELVSCVEGSRSVEGSHSLGLLLIQLKKKRKFSTKLKQN